MAYVAMQVDIPYFKKKLVSFHLRTQSLEEATMVAQFLNDHIHEFDIQEITG